MKHSIFSKNTKFLGFLWLLLQILFQNLNIFSTIFFRLKIWIRKLFGFLDVYIHALWCWFWFVLCGIINCPTNGRHQWLLIAPSTSSSVLIQSTFMWTYMMIDFQIPLCQSHKNVVLEWLSQLRAFCDVQNIIAEMLKHRTLKKEIKRCEWI